MKPDNIFRMCLALALGVIALVVGFESTITALTMLVLAIMLVLKAIEQESK